MALAANLVRAIELLRRAWPGGRTIDDLARELNIQPWRAADLIGRCESLGVRVERAGPALQTDPSELPLLAELIEIDIEARRVGRSLIVFPQVSSTNDVAWQAARRRESDGLIVLAESQTAGRGRFGRSWLAAPGQSLLFSLLLLDVPVVESLANRMVMAASLAMAEAIGDVADLPVTIRWPNDLYLHGRKVGGILLESRSSPGPDRRNRVDLVLGIGINCNQSIQDFPKELHRKAGSLAIELGRRIDRTALMRAAVVQLDARLSEDMAERTSGEARDSRLRSAYVQRMDHEARRVRIVHDARTIEATVRDVDPISGLIVELPAGGVAHFSPAQVSLEWI